MSELPMLAETLLREQIAARAAADTGTTDTDEEEAA